MGIWEFRINHPCLTLSGFARVTPSLPRRGRQPKGASPLDPRDDEGMFNRHETRRGAPFGAAGVYPSRGYGGLNPHHRDLKNLILIELQRDLREITMGPRALAASSGLAPWSMAVDRDLRLHEIVLDQFLRGKQPVGISSSRERNPPPERTACLWRRFGGKGGLGGVALAFLTPSCCLPLWGREGVTLTTSTEDAGTITPEHNSSIWPCLTPSSHGAPRSSRSSSSPSPRSS